LWRASPCPDYRVDALAVQSLHARGARESLIERFTSQACVRLPDEASWEAYLKARVIVEAEEVRWARLASRVAQGWRQETVILGDGAGQFAILYHALRGIQAERALRRRVPPEPVQRQAQARVLDEGWTYYRALKAYQASPQAEEAARLSAQFDALWPAGDRLSCPGQGAQAAASEQSGSVAGVGTAGHSLTSQGG
jgi:hypothetical protein